MEKPFWFWVDHKAIHDLFNTGTGATLLRPVVVFVCLGGTASTKLSNTIYLIIWFTLYVGFMYFVGQDKATNALIPSKLNTFHKTVLGKCFQSLEVNTI